MIVFASLLIINKLQVGGEAIVIIPQFAAFLPLFQTEHL
jgi:hypothetical protein